MLIANFFLYCLVAATYIFTIFSGVKIATTFAPDFSIFYNASLDVLHNVSPYFDTSLYTTFNYPLASTLFFMPFTLFPYQIAQSIFTFLNILSVFVIVFVSFALLQKRISLLFFLATVAIAFLSFPTKFTLGMGQTNLLAYALLLLSFLFYTRKRLVVFGICFIAAIFLKPILGATLIMFLFEKQWKLFFLTLGMSTITALSIPLLFNQPNANSIFINNIFHQSLQGREVYYNQGILGFISRLTNSLLLRFVLNIFFTIQLIVISLWSNKNSLTKQLSLLLTLLVIIDPLSWQHHFVFLIFPFLAVFLAVQKVKTKKVLQYSIFFLSLFLVSINIKSPEAFMQFPLSFLLSHQLYGALLLFFLELKML